MSARIPREIGPYPLTPQRAARDLRPRVGVCWCKACCAVHPERIKSLEMDRKFIKARTGMAARSPGRPKGTT